MGRGVLNLKMFKILAKIRELLLSLSLIMGFIMGGSEFFSNFLSGLSHQQRPRAGVWACTLTRGNPGHI